MATGQGRTGQSSLARTVYPRTPHEWVNERSGSHDDVTVHASREAAVEAAEKMIRYAGGGVLTVKDAQGEIRHSSDISAGTRVPVAQVSTGPNAHGDRQASDRHAMSDSVSDVEPIPALKGADKSFVPQ